MQIRDIVKEALHRVSPALAVRCIDLWDSVQPIIRRRMTPSATAKYFVRGLCPGLRGRFTYYGTTVYFPAASFLFRMVCEKGTWEPEVTAWLCRTVEPGTWFIDVGANIGLISIPVLQAVSNSHVLSFEPSPNSAPYLERTGRDSRMRDRWEVITKAAGDSVGTVRFCIASPRSGAWDGLRDTGLAGERRCVEVIKTTVDNEWRRVGCPRVSCMKVDVEGAESYVLKGANEMVHREKPRILLEWSAVNLAPYGVEAGFLLEYADSHGYCVLTFPSLNGISTEQDLQLGMLDAEMFLLIPRDDRGTK
jgi:FkbM family methyltransferase